MMMARFFTLVAALGFFCLSLLFCVRIAAPQFVADMVSLHGGAMVGVPVAAPVPEIEWGQNRILWRGTLTFGPDIQAGSLAVDFFPGTWRQWVLAQEDKPLLVVKSVTIGEVRAALDLDGRGINLSAIVERMRNLSSGSGETIQRLSVQEIALRDVEVFAREYREARSGEVFPLENFAMVPPLPEAATLPLFMAVLLDEVRDRSVSEAFALGLLVRPVETQSAVAERPRESSAPVRRKEGVGKKAARAVNDFFKKLK